MSIALPQCSWIQTSGWQWLQKTFFVKANSPEAITRFWPYKSKGINHILIYKPHGIAILSFTLDSLSSVLSPGHAIFEAASSSSALSVPVFQNIEVWDIRSAHNVAGRFTCPKPPWNITSPQKRRLKIELENIVYYCGDRVSEFGLEWKFAYLVSPTDTIWAWNKLEKKQLLGWQCRM